MATPAPNNSSTSDESPEYSAMRENYHKLIDLLSPSISSLGNILFSQKLIPKAILDKLRMSSVQEADKTGELLSHLMNRVEHEPSVFHEFVKALKEHDPSNKMVVEMLMTSYQSHRAIHDVSLMSLKSSDSQSKLRLEFTVPQDFPQEVFTVLESVQVSVLVEDQNKSRTALMETQLRVNKDNRCEQEETPLSREPQVPWIDEPGRSHGAVGRRDVLLIVSKLSATDNPDIVPRRSRGPLTEEERRKLEEQGIHEEYCHSDLSIMTARYGLDKRRAVVGVVSAEKTTCEGFKSRVTDLMNTTDKEGVVIHYIGPGKKGTGDWCFNDGFISFREIMDLYTQHFRGHVLTITSDCSYSGSWVREAMVFMDEQGVGPCGHVAKEKGILVKVYASCLANEIPAELAFSTHGITNDLNTGTVGYNVPEYRGNEIHDGQHYSRLDFTQVRCKNKIDQPCTMAPGSTWERWRAKHRLMTVCGIDRGRPAWHYLLPADDEETIARLIDRTTGENAGKHRINVTDYGQVIKSGWGEDPPDEIEKEMKNYFVNYNHL